MRIGTSGWSYPAWEGDFYPADLPRAQQLTYLASQLDAVEVNATFYRLQTPETFHRWRAEVPRGFSFAVKGSRYITHLKRLHDVAQPLANFFASGVLSLGSQLGPLLWQLPKAVPFDPKLLSGFLDLLPTTTSEAATLAAGHDTRVRHPWLDVEADLPMRHVLEPRDESFAAADALELLQSHACGLVVADTAGTFPELSAVTSSVVYVRLHGSEQLYRNRYSDEELRKWTDRVVGWWSAGLDVDVFFDNDAAGHAPHDAVRLARLIDRETRSP